MTGVNVILSDKTVNYTYDAVSIRPRWTLTLMKTVLFGVILMVSGTGTAQILRDKAEIREAGKMPTNLNGDGAPIVRVNLLEGYEKVDFHIYGSFNIEDLAGNLVLSGIKSTLRWRAKLEESIPSEFSYHVLLKSFLQRENAEKLADSLSAGGHKARALEIGGIYQVNEDVVIDSRKYRTVAGEFDCAEDTSAFIEMFSEHFRARVVRFLIRPSYGKVEFFDGEYEQSGLVNDGFRLIPLTPLSKVLVHGVKVGTGFHWENEEDRVYPGMVEIRIDNDGRLCVINEVSIDQYLKGVVPSEMPPRYPAEALKAQSIAARSDALAKLGGRHLNDPYDLCATVHCQVYSGLNHRSPLSDSAVESTAGEVLTIDNRICNTVYSSVCGGHTESKENVWNSEPESYLKGHFDSANKRIEVIDLSDEDDLKRWVDSEPPCYCNAFAHGSPPALNGSGKYFRWEEIYSRSTLESIIVKKTGADLGTFCGLEIIKRGESGRIIELEILGSVNNVRLKSELSIRRALSETTLRSSCFYVTMSYDADSIPSEIVFHGAGWGHGVGMCQVGAAVMALEGKNYRQILSHYYRGTKVKKIYSLKKSASKKQRILLNQEAEEN